MAGPSAILTAVYRRDTTTLARLLAAGTMPTLYEAAAMGDAARVRALARAEPAALARRSPDGEMRIITRLLASGADVNARAAGGYGPLHIAAFHDDVALVATLLAHGADAGPPTDDGRTALAIAEAQGQALVARRLRGELP